MKECAEFPRGGPACFRGQGAALASDDGRKALAGCATLAGRLQRRSWNQGEPMALIDCPDCQKPVSSEAPSCPNCGRPIKQTNVSVPTTATAQGGGRGCPHCGSPSVGKVRGLQGIGEVILGAILIIAGIIPGIIYYAYIESVPYCTGCGRRV